MPRWTEHPDPQVRALAADLAAVRERTEKAERAYMDLMAERNQIHAERDEAREALSDEEGRRLAVEEDLAAAVGISATKRERIEALAAQVCEYHRAAGVVPDQVCVPCLQAQLHRLEVERGGRES